MNFRKPLKEYNKYFQNEYKSPTITLFAKKFVLLHVNNNIRLFK